MKNSILIANEPAYHLIYFDTNILKRLFKYEELWHNFFEKFSESNLSLFEISFDIIFTWYQLLEYIGIADILIEIDKQYKIDLKKKKFEEMTMDKSINAYFHIILNIVHRIPSLQKNSLLQLIDNELTFSKPHAQILLNQSILKARRFIEKENYLEDFSWQVMWAYVTANPFFKPIEDNEQLNSFFQTLLFMVFIIRTGY